MRILLYCAIAAMLAGVPLFAGEPLFPIYAGGHFGFMGKTGKIVIEPKFIRVSRFSEGLAAVGIRDPDTKYGYVDDTGTVVIAPRFYDALPFSEGLAVVQTGSRWGYINRIGEPAFSQEFDYARSFFEGRAAVLVNWKWGYIDKNGQWVIRPQFDHAERFSEGLARVQNLERDTPRYKYIDTTGKDVFEIKSFFFDLFRGLSVGCIEGIAAASLNGNFSEALATAELNGQWGFVDRTGKFAIAPRFQMVRSFSEGLAAVQINGRWGFIDKSGQLVISAEFLEVGSLSEGLARFLSVGSVWGYIDRTGKIVIPARFAYGQVIDAPEDAFDGAFRNGLAEVTVNLSKTRAGSAYIDRGGRIVWKGK